MKLVIDNDRITGLISTIVSYGQEAEDYDQGLRDGYNRLKSQGLIRKIELPIIEEYFNFGGKQWDILN